MSVTQTLRAVELLRSFGVPVTFENGWDTRGNGQSSAYQGGIIHHTGGSYASTCPGILIVGRSDLRGPLCNFAGLSNGGIHVVAAHPANHAGASGGPSNGPFPVTSLFNKLVMGLEICYPGNEPMTDSQYHTAKVFAKVMEIMFGSIERARAHRETSIEGKWDPGWAPGQTIDMAGLRSAAASMEGDDDMALNADADYEAFKTMMQRFLAFESRPGGAAPTHDNGPTIYERLGAISDALAEVKAEVAKIQTGGVSEQRIGEIAVDAVKKDLED